MRMILAPFRVRRLLSAPSIAAVVFAFSVSVPAFAQVVIQSPEEIQQNLQQYLQQPDFCCDTAAEKNFGLCSPGYPTLEACSMNAPGGGTIFSITDGKGCAISCGLEAGLFYCQNPDRAFGEAAVCEQKEPPTLQYGYPIKGDCMTACAIPEPFEAKSATCWCGLNDDVVCSVRIDRPFVLEMPIAANGGGGPQRTGAGQVAETPLDIPMTLSAWVEGGDQATLGQNWVTKASFLPSEGQDPVAKAVTPSCTGSTCDFRMVRREPGNLTITMRRASLPALTSPDPLEFKAELKKWRPTDPAPPRVTAAIPLEAKCADDKQASIQCRYDGLPPANATLPQRALVTYTISVPDVSGNVAVMDNLKDLDNDAMGCLEDNPLLDIIDLHQAGGFIEFGIPGGFLQQSNAQGNAQLPICQGNNPQASCCSLVQGQVYCAIIPPLRAGGVQTYSISIKNIPVDPDQRCVNQVIYNTGQVERVANQFENTSITEVTVPVCPMSECDLCEQTNPRLTKGQCDSDQYKEKCEWVGPDNGGNCKKRPDKCGGFYGACVQSTTNAERRRIVWGGYDAENLNRGFMASRNNNRSDYALALSLHGFNGLTPPADWTGVWTVARFYTPLTNAQIAELENRCISRFNVIPPVNEPGGPGGNIPEIPVPEPDEETPDLYCESNTAVDMSGVTELYDFDPVEHNLTIDGLVYKRVAIGEESNARRYYKAGAGTDPVYARQYALGLRPLDPSADTKDSAQACKRNKRYGFCLSGDPASRSMGCGLMEISKCVAGRGAVIGERGNLSELSTCNGMANRLNGGDPAAQAALSAGQTVGQELLNLLGF